MIAASPIQGQSGKPRILIIGDAVAQTGFARVIRSIFQLLHDKYELHQLATRYDGGPHDYPWKLYPAGSGASVYGYDQIQHLIERIQPAVIFLLYDIPFQVPYMEHLGAAAPEAKVVIYSPVEAGPIAPEVMRQMRGPTRYVLYTDYGKREIAKAVAVATEEDPAFSFPALDVIPHGVDTKRFFPLPNGDEQAGDEG